MAIKEYQITPRGKPRMTRRDKWAKRPCVTAYYEYCNKLREIGVTVPESGASVFFVLPMPKSWSKKKKQEMMGRPHQQKPDVDNMLKALLDAVYKDDSSVWEITVTKLWGAEGKIVIKEP